VRLEAQADQCGLELLDLIPGGLKFAVVIVRSAAADLAERGQGGLAGIGEGMQVPLRGGNLGVAESLLHHLEVRAAGEQP
jgi:hypothetical protein